MEESGLGKSGRRKEREAILEGVKGIRYQRVTAFMSLFFSSPHF